MKKSLRIPGILAGLLALCALMMAYVQPAAAHASAATTSRAHTSSPYKVNSCTTYDIGDHSQALPPTLYTNAAYGFSMYYLGKPATPQWVTSQDASGVHFYPKGNTSTNGENLTIKLDNAKSESPEAFLRRLIGPAANKCQASQISFGSFNSNPNIMWTSIAVNVTIKATHTQTKQLYMTTTNPKTGQVLAAIFTNDPAVSANTNLEDLRYMMDTFTFI